MLADVSTEVRVVDLSARRARGSVPAVLRLPGTIRVLAPRLLLKGRPKVMACLNPLVEYLRRERPEALLSSVGYNGLVAIWAREIAGVSTRLVVREASALTERVSNGRKYEVRWLPQLISEWYPKADVVVAVSDGVREDLERTAGLRPGLARTIYNGVDTDRIEKLAAEPVDHPWLTSDDAVPVVLTVGRYKPQKGHETLLRAFARIRERRLARLLILGEGKDRAKLEALVAELRLGQDVNMPGFAANPYAFMARADLFVLSSNWEGFPNVLVEALAAGCKVVSTDCPSGPGEVLDGGRWGSLVPVADPEALARAMEAGLDAEPDPARSRSRARNFSVEHALDRYFEALLPKSPSDEAAG
jgi:glycosyltransferase involved in cell wall biosynthesis